MNLISIGIVFGILTIIGIIFSGLITYIKCSKYSSEAIMEGLYWSIPTTLVYALVNYSDYVRTEFENSGLSYFAWMGVNEETKGIFAIAYPMMLMSWVVTTRMIHTSEIAVCKPNKNELKKFEKDLEKELKEKEDAKQENLAHK